MVCFRIFRYHVTTQNIRNGDASVPRDRPPRARPGGAPPASGPPPGSPPASPPGPLSSSGSGCSLIDRAPVHQHGILELSPSRLASHLPGNSGLVSSSRTRQHFRLPTSLDWMYRPNLARAAAGWGATDTTTEDCCNGWAAQLTASAESAVGQPGYPSH